MQKLKISLILLFSPYILMAQEGATEQKKPINSPAFVQRSLHTGTIANQFEYIYNVSNNYQDYKVIKKANLEKLKDNVIDSLQKMQSQLANAKHTLSTHDQEVATLQDSLNKVNQDLKITKEQKESFSFLGIWMSKGSYNALVWCTIGILLIILIFYIYRFKQSNAVTTDARKTLEEVRADFEQHRKKAMEREQKLNRQLQDELNKRL